MKVSSKVRPNVRQLSRDRHSWPEWWAILMTDRRDCGQPIRAVSRQGEGSGFPTLDPDRVLVFPTRRLAATWLKKWVNRVPRWLYTVERIR